MSDVNPISMGPHDGRARSEFDQERAERAVTELLLAIGEDPSRDGLRDTPARVARAFRENFEGLWQSPEDILTTTFDIGHKELVIVRDIEIFLTANITSLHSMEWHTLDIFLASQAESQVSPNSHDLLISTRADHKFKSGLLRRLLTQSSKFWIPRESL